MKLILSLIVLMSVSTGFAQEIGESQAASCDQSIHLGRFQTEKIRDISSEEIQEEVVVEEVKTISK